MQKVKCYKCGAITENYLIFNYDIPEKAICNKCLLEVKDASIARFDVKYHNEHKDDK